MIFISLLIRINYCGFLLLHRTKYCRECQEVDRGDAAQKTVIMALFHFNHYEILPLSSINNWRNEYIINGRINTKTTHLQQSATCSPRSRKKK